jgi:hypothetical protein
LKTSSSLPRLMQGIQKNWEKIIWTASGKGNIISLLRTHSVWK